MLAVQHLRKAVKKNLLSGGHSRPSGVRLRRVGRHDRAVLHLRMLMRICSLGKAAGWMDPAKIPVSEIVQIWREEASLGRYANQLIWGVEGLLEAQAATEKATA